MDDLEEAKQLIREIREEKGVDDSGGLNANARTLARTLKILSSQLYSTATRFILELVQNADDNKYDLGTTPKLTLLYREDGFLWLGCNERGFTAKDVRSICDAGDSTKKIESCEKKYIGEKGIGFKAVFTVADIVWIKSGALSFKFHRDRELGEVVPQWADFPINPLVNERTMFCLRIPADRDRNVVLKSLEDLKPELLMFLRQLRCIDIKTTSSTAAVCRDIALRRDDSVTSGVRLTTLHSASSLPAYHHKIASFLVFEHTTTAMPEDEKRSGITRSTLLMAFPVDSKLNSVVQSRDTFNFLPIRPFGFSFLLQADFLLNAPREEILKDSPWNKTLVSAALDLFVRSVNSFNDKGLLKYQWPRYAKPDTTVAGTIFADFFNNLRKRLVQCTVLVSRAMTLELPSALQMLPQVFTDGGCPSNPLIRRKGGLKSYLCSDYDYQDIIGAQLGVPELEYNDFCKLLTRYVELHTNDFRVKSSTWHSRVAEALLHTGVRCVQSVKLIPLQGGEWVSADDKPFYFAEISDNLKVPAGVKIVVVDERAGQDGSRRKLYTQLGAQVLDAARVFQIIVNQHKDAAAIPPDWSLEMLLGHA